MRYFYTVLLVMFCVLFNASAQVLPDPLNVSGVTAEYDGGNTASITLSGNSDIKINGSVTTESVTIDAGSYLFVAGDLDIITNGAAKLTVNGTLVVTGSLNIQSSGNSEDNTIEATGVLVVGGSYDIGGNKETNEGTVFLSDPNDGGGLVGDGGDLGDLGDLITADPPVLSDDVIEDLIENVDDPTLIPPVTWQGGTSDVWTEATNWLDGNQPTDFSRIVIDKITNGSDAKITSSMGEVKIAAVTITTGSLLIEEGARVTFLNDITTNGNLVVSNSDGTPSSVIFKGTVTGDITFTWTLGALHWWFMGHPIYNPSMQVYRDVESGGTEYALYDYQSSGLVNLADDAGFEFTSTVDSEDILRGYQFKAVSQVTLSHTGLVNNSDVYGRTLQTGWQIVANPYPSHYQLPVNEDGTGDFASTDGTVYVSNSDTNAGKSFEAFNVFSGLGSTSFDGIIAPGQAFYIKTAASAGAGDKLYMSASNRVHATGVSLKSTAKPVETDVLRLKLSNDFGLTDEAVIALRENGSFEMNKFDSQQLMQSGTDYSFIYSMVDEKKAVINVLPQLTSNHGQAIGIKAVEGKQSLKIVGLDNLTEEYEVVLEDKANGNLTPMSSSTVYEFTAAAGEDHSRFVLHFNVTPKTEVPTDIDDVNDNDMVIYIQNGSTLMVSNEWNVNEKRIDVYTLSGSLVMSDSFTGRRFSKDLNVNAGVYIVKVSGGNKASQQKVFIK
ncbi:T9SS type A sorting domain-containing protein [Carboxylicivirga sp. RSCT41]|uniref:T9SS type A sorting domain-containing protein n=1 Tax=Carboxylicivirga agarovorans TaxID=3417570 RepID=UPI003D32F562